MIWALALGIVTALIGTAIFVFRRRVHAGDRDMRRDLGFAVDLPLEPKSDLGYALVRSIPLWLGGITFIVLALLAPN